jgi:murein L,D-transpeptidase YcbB/YkuD
MCWVRFSLLAASIAIWAVLETGLAHAQTESLDREIRSRVERLMQSGELWIGESPVAATHLISEFYVERQFRAAWSSERNVAALLDVIEQSEGYGFDSEDFHRSHLVALIEESGRDKERAAARADLDILLTDAIVRLAYMHYFGKVDPVALDDNWNFERPLLRRDPVKVLNEVLDGEQIGALIEDLKLSSPFYDNLISALARYRFIARQGGWPAVPPGPALKPGMSDSRISVLRARLAATGDLEGSDARSPLYDADLEIAIRRFQKRHGLDVDGVIGPGSLAALNVPVEARIEQIRVNLERARWVLRGLGGDFVIVNIAGFKTYLVRDGQVVWKTKSIVGRDYRKTPVFRDEIRYMDFNPTWTVPPGILAKDIIPKARKDPSYLTNNEFSLIDRNGGRIDPNSVDWSNAKARGFPYSVVQSPGPHNALGLVKFMFPNPYLVYLHDTPGRGLFARAERTFSSGCVRVENPFDFAELLLEDKPGWTREKIDQVVASGKTLAVHLQTPLPVLLLYWTAWAYSDGLVDLRRDIYGRDGRVLDALNDAFSPKPLIRAE